MWKTLPKILTNLEKLKIILGRRGIQGMNNQAIRERKNN